MIPIDRFERRLEDSLADLAGEQVPPYVTDLLARTARQRQRPAWTFPERWLPMTIALPGAATLPHRRSLAAGLILLLAALIAVPALTRVGLQPAAAPPLPRNGMIAFPPDEGHIHRLDPSTGSGSLWLRTDAPPRHLTWSPDGTRLAWAEGQAGGSSHIAIVCAPEGENCGTPPMEVFRDLRVLRWAPDGTRLLVVSAGPGGNVIALVPADASGGATTETLDLGMSVDWATWAPDGASILVKGTGADDVPRLYRVPLDGDRTPQPLLEVDTSTPLFARWGGSEFLWDPAYGPDGSTIMYSTVADLLSRQSAEGQNARVRMVDADGTDDRLFEISPDSDYEVAAGWSPDGTRVAIATQHLDDHLLAIAPIADPTKATIVGPDPAITEAERVIWSPDGSTLLSWGTDGSAALIDAVTGAIEPLARSIPSEAAWQPVLP